MINVGITGQPGFIGTHLYNSFGLKQNIVRIPFEDCYFENETSLNEFVGKCNVIVHLAAMNRHGDPNVIYNTNIRLVKQVIDACLNTASRPHIIFASSIQEERDNLYGKAKKEGRMLFEEWAEKNNASFTGLILPNVFGPFGHPYYNSVVATFCHQLANNEHPRIEIDAELKLIYVSEVAEIVYKSIIEKSDRNKTVINSGKVNHTKTIKVSDLLSKIEKMQKEYFEFGIIPNLDEPFDRNLYNTFLCYIDHKSFFPFMLTNNTDNRGNFVELIKLNSGGQVSFSTTVPEITRGNHYHTRKAERFAVIKGKATIELRKIGSEEILSFELDGSKPSFVDMPVWYTHNITNTGKNELYTIFWINEPYNSDDPDTFFEKV